LAFLAIACGEYLAILLPLFSGRESGVGIVMLMLFALVNVLGLKADSGTQQLSSALKALALLVFVGVCCAAPSNVSAASAAHGVVSISRLQLPCSS